MAKISKVATKAHNEAEELVASEKILNDDERMFVLENWSPLQSHNIGQAGAFFTPYELACDTMIELPEDATTVIDLCAGIGMLTFCAWQKFRWQRDMPKFICVEINPNFVRVGRKVMPEATWIQGSVMDKSILDQILTFVDDPETAVVISNPPFGTTRMFREECDVDLRYTGNLFEYAVMDVSSRFSTFGIFIIPQGSAPFEFSGKRTYKLKVNQDGNPSNDKYNKFHEETGLALGMNCGIDTQHALEQWVGTRILTEICLLSNNPD